MSMWGSGSPATYCQPSAMVSFIYAALRNELYTHLAPQALFVWSSPGHVPLLFFPVCSPTLLLQLESCFSLFRVRVRRCPSPLSGGVCYALATFTSLPLSKHTGGGVIPLLPSPICLFIYRSCEGVPPPLSGGAYYTLSTFTSLSLSKHTGGGAAALLSSAGLFVYRSCEGVPLPHFPELRAPCPLC
jgi:hypothetical protein